MNDENSILGTYARLCSAFGDDGVMCIRPVSGECFDIVAIDPDPLLGEQAFALEGSMRLSVVGDCRGISVFVGTTVHDPDRTMALRCTLAGGHEINWTRSGSFSPGDVANLPVLVARGLPPITECVLDPGGPGIFAALVKYTPPAPVHARKAPRR
jgi:hypothetical protein